MRIMNLKNLTKVKNNSIENENGSPSESVDAKHTYAMDGRKKCGEATGNPQILKTSIEENYEKFKQESRDNLVKQEELKRPNIEERERQRSLLKKRETIKGLKEEELNDVRKEIAKIDSDIAEVRANPEKFGIDVDKKSRANFYIGLVLLLPITLYLIVFYISASYSAFFRDFLPDANVVQSIFDGQAVSKAMNDPNNGGWQNVVLICTIPFAFMGLGYLIHMFQNSPQKRWLNTLKIIALFGVTFIFDALLAYYIDKKIFDLNKMPGQEYDLQMAFQSADFWIIIFAGFVVYIIWGLVFDFIMKEHENMDKIAVFIDGKRKEKTAKKEVEKSLKELLTELKTEIAAIEGVIQELTAKINGFVFESRAYLLYHTEFVNGWNLAIGSIALAADVKEGLLQSCRAVSDEHLTKYKLTENDAENIIYLKSN